MGLIITRYRFVESRMVRVVCAESVFKEEEVLLLR